MNQWVWRRVGIASSLVALVLLTTEHFLGHGRDLNPVDHWLSEYVLSGSALAVWVMRIAFVGLSLAALSVAAVSKEKLFFILASAGLVAMPFCDTYPNDGIVRPMWPLTAGNVHQLLLYAAIGSALLGIVIQNYRRRCPMPETSLLLFAAIATGVQTYLVADSQATGRMTYFGGITERIIVVAMLAWVMRSLSRPARDGAKPGQPERSQGTSDAIKQPRSFESLKTSGSIKWR